MSSGAGSKSRTPALVRRALNLGERCVLQRRARAARALSISPSMLGFTGTGIDHEIDSARGQLIAKLHDRLDRIGLNARGVRAMFQLRRSEKRRAGDVIDIGPIEEPSIAAEIHLLIPDASLPVSTDCIGGSSHCETTESVSSAFSAALISAARGRRCSKSQRCARS